MKRFFSSVLVAAALLGASLLAVSTATAGPEEQMREAAQAFLASLSPEQRATATFPFADAERLNWHFIPRERKGLPLKAMNAKQRSAALHLLRHSLSAEGYQDAEGVRALEGVLRHIEKRDQRDPENYFVTIFGAPSASANWGWRYEGHHLALNWTVAGGRTVATSPQFYGSNPAEVRVDAPGGPPRGTKVLGEEEELARALLDSLTDAQRREAIVGTTAPADIFSGAEKSARPQAQDGVTYGSLSPEQQGKMRALVHHYAGKQPRELAEQRIQRIIEAGPDGVRFAWMGSTEKNRPHYYRVQGPTFLIEYDNIQNDANHVHSVWRDFKGDFGADLLALHYQSDPHHRQAQVRVSPASRLAE